MKIKKCLRLSVLLIKTICQFQLKLCLFIFIIILTFILDCFSLFISFFLGTGNIQQYLVIVIFFVLYVCVMRNMREKKIGWILTRYEQGRVEYRKNSDTLQRLRCNGFFTIASLQQVHFNGFVATALLQWFFYSLLPMFTNKATIFLDDGLYQKISIRCKGLLLT